MKAIARSIWLPVCLMLVSVSSEVLGANQDLSTEPDDSAAYCEVHTVIGNSDDPRRAEGSGSCLLYPGHGPCNGVIYLRGDESGQSVGSIINDQDSVQFEILYSLAMDYDNTLPVLDGSVYALVFDANGEVSRGRKVLLHDTLQFGESRTISFPTLHLPKPITITYRVLSQVPGYVTSYGAQTLSLTSIQYVDGKPWSTCGNTKPLYDMALEYDRYSFQTTFSSLPAQGKNKTLYYRVYISFDPPLSSDRLPAKSMMTFDRVYWLDTLQQGEKAADAQWGTSTSFRKQVEIARGKALKLIFPADEPAINGFRIEDTVTIIP